MLVRTRKRFIEPCLPSRAERRRLVQTGFMSGQYLPGFVYESLNQALDSNFPR